jgi:hypothetical protein
MSVAELESGLLSLVKQLYSAEETADRRRRFKMNLKRLAKQRKAAQISATQLAA